MKKETKYKYILIPKTFGNGSVNPIYLFKVVEVTKLANSMDNTLFNIYAYENGVQVRSMYEFDSKTEAEYQCEKMNNGTMSNLINDVSYLKAELQTIKDAMRKIWN